MRKEHERRAKKISKRPRRLKGVLGAPDLVPRLLSGVCSPVSSSSCDRRLRGGLGACDHYLSCSEALMGLTRLGGRSPCPKSRVNSRWFARRRGRGFMGHSARESRNNSIGRTAWPEAAADRRSARGLLLLLFQDVSSGTTPTTASPVAAELTSHQDEPKEHEHAERRCASLRRRGCRGGHDREQRGQLDRPTGRSHRQLTRALIGRGDLAREVPLAVSCGGADGRPGDRQRHRTARCATRSRCRRRFTRRDGRVTEH